jgi:hypothetical protein
MTAHMRAGRDATAAHLDVDFHALCVEGSPNRTPRPAQIAVHHDIAAEQCRCQNLFTSPSNAAPSIPLPAPDGNHFYTRLRECFARLPFGEPWKRICDGYQTDTPRRSMTFSAVHGVRNRSTTR